MDPFMSSDDKGDDIDGALPDHLVKDISEIDMEDVDQSNKICDLLVSTRKSKSSSKRKERKTRPKNPKKHQNGFVMIGIFWNCKGLSDLTKFRYVADILREKKSSTLLRCLIQERTKCQRQIQIASLEVLVLSGIAFHQKEDKEGILLGINVAILDLSLIVEGVFFY
jgi:hypothetical protein